MKSILISVKPKWVEKILNGEKTIEIRKSMPKCALPCNVYIYCTMGFNPCIIHRSKPYVANGKVVAEFTLREVEQIKRHQVYNGKVIKENACMSIQQLSEYTKGKNFYCWHIDDLIIYDEPKELSNFIYLCPKSYNDMNNFLCYKERNGGKISFCKYSKNGECNAYIKRPPQSWCYVDEEG